MWAQISSALPGSLRVRTFVLSIPDGIGWIQLPSKEDKPRERNLRDGGVYGEVVYG